MNYEELLLQVLEEDDRFIVLTAENRAAMRNLPNKISGRFIDVGIAEQTMIGMAAGLALRGRIPVVHALSTFLTMRAFEFIRTDIGIAHLPVKLVGAVAGFLSEANGPTHQALEDISLMRGIPGIKIFSPADEEDFIFGMKKILPDPHPWYIRYNNLPPVVKHSEFEFGKAEQFDTGSDITILSHGFLLREAVLAADHLRNNGLSAGVVNIRTINPLDEDIILSSAKNSSLLVILEDHFITGGLYSAVCEVLVRKNINCSILPVGLKTWFKPALLASVLQHEKFTGKDIADKIITKLNKAVSLQ